MILADLFLSFFKVGFFSFGGGYAILPIIREEVVVYRQWITEAVFIDLIAIAQMTPGPIAINTATFAGYQLAGIPGAATATIGLIASPALVVTILAAVMTRFRRTPVIQGVMKALTPALLALITYSAFSVARVAVTGAIPALLAVVMVVVLVRTTWHPLVVILGSLVAGMVLL